MLTIKQVKDAVLAKKYVWFEDEKNKSYDVNIVGVRTNNKKITNKFDDFITLSFKNEKGEWQFYAWQCTCDPGVYYMRKKLLSSKGCARLKEGQYRSSHHIALHQGKYEALCQQKPVTVYRDANLDDNYDEAKTETGLFGINIHKGGADSLTVDNWSAGCTVFKRQKDFNEFMSLCKKAKAIHGNSFTYTLILSSDIV